MNDEDLAKMDLADVEIEYRQVAMQRDDLLAENKRLNETLDKIHEAMQRGHELHHKFAQKNKGTKKFDVHVGVSTGFMFAMWDVERIREKGCE